MSFLVLAANGLSFWRRKKKSINLIRKISSVLKLSEENDRFFLPEMIKRVHNSEEMLSQTFT